MFMKNKRDSRITFFNVNFNPKVPVSSVCKCRSGPVLSERVWELEESKVSKRNDG